MNAVAEIEQVQFLSFRSIRPSPENDELYRPVTADDPEVVALAQSIRERGILEPLVVTLDRFILSGHRRYVAAKINGMVELPCRVVELRRSDDREAFTVALREYNRQRVKSFDEKVREAVVSMKPGEAYSTMIEERKKRSKVEAPVMELRQAKPRSKISEASMPFLEAVIKIVYDLEDEWPISQRDIHYNLLNDPPLTHASKPDSRYRTDDAKKTWSGKLSRLVTRAVIEGSLPENAIEDAGRPVTILSCHRDSGTFINEQLEGFLAGYSRDTTQSQTNHIELVVEKNTVARKLEQVALNYGIPMTSGHGYSSIPPRVAMKNRYLRSGKEKLVIIVVSDFDPDGEEIGHSFARLMRDDFGLSVEAVKAGLTLEQVKRLKLRSSHHAKESSSNYKRFAAKYGSEMRAYELETLTPDQLREEVTKAIHQVLDMEAFRHELEQEKHESVKIQSLRRAVMDTLKASEVTK